LSEEVSISYNDREKENKFFYKDGCDKCGKRYIAEFPEGVNGIVNFGDSIKSLVT